MTSFAEIRRVLRHREFRFLWLAQSSSVIGDYLVLVALALFVIGQTGSASDLGLVLAAKALPLVGFLLVGGVWADRLPRHRVMMAADLIRFALHGLLAVLIFEGAVPIWQLIAIEMLYGSAEAFFRPAADGLLPQTVPEHDIQQARAITAMSNNLAEFAGPALATALVLGAGAGWAFALDAATFLLSAAFLSRVRPRRRGAAIAAITTEPAAAASGGMWSEIRAGSREVRSRPWVWATLLTFCAALFFALAPWFVLGPIIARGQYGHVSVYGILEATVGLGTILGALAGVGWRPRFPMRTAMLAIMAWPVAAILYASGTTLFVVLPVTLLAGSGIAVFDILWTTALAERIPPGRLSRVSSFDWMISGALLPLGYAIAGPLGSALGAVPVMIGGSVLALVAFVLGLLPRDTRMLERIVPGETAAAAEEPLLGITHRH
ncbi:MAG TPA: MFS transporter [Solirubrobacteraceae bacterium]|jgi:MFS family permease|nr:MFS transporter [Solirubrobacteraceae bacterium]